MKFTPNTFDVTTWETDINIFNGKPILLKVDPEFGAGEITGIRPDTPLIILGVQWYYEVFHNKKSILKYVVKDDYWVSIVERNNDVGELNEMIKDSYAKTKREFDKRIRQITLGYELHPLEQAHIDVVRSAILSKMREKGV